VINTRFRCYQRIKQIKYLSFSFWSFTSRNTLFLISALDLTPSVRLPVDRSTRSDVYRKPYYSSHLGWYFSGNTFRHQIISPINSHCISTTAAARSTSIYDFTVSHQLVTISRIIIPRCSSIYPSTNN